jgi:ligand-binding sensor domain-containing protein
MRIVTVVIAALFFSSVHGQFPYVKKISFPDQLPAQEVYDMLTDSKGYIWLGTDKGLYRFNGRIFVAIPFDSTSSKSVSFLQEDDKGTIWCMNFYNQVFSLRKDTLRRFAIDYKTLKGSPTFSNLMVCEDRVWLHSFNNIFEFDKKSHQVLFSAERPSLSEQIITSTVQGNKFYAFTSGGSLFVSDKKETGWQNTGKKIFVPRFLQGKRDPIVIGVSYDRKNPLQITRDSFISWKPPALPAEIFVFHGVALDNDEYWLCTQNGAYKWNKETEEVKCYFPNERVTDVVKDYQGNYWFSTLDNGVFICSSLNNSLIKIYNSSLLDNFRRIRALPNGDILAGNSQGTMVRINLDTYETIKYDVEKQREVEFIFYDSVNKKIICNRGVFDPARRTPVEVLDYSKGVERDKFGNLIVALFNGAIIMNDHFNTEGQPVLDCPLYQDRKKDTMSYLGKQHVLILRSRRTLSLLSSADKDCFWVGYEDGLYEYHYNGVVKELKDNDGNPVVAKSLQQYADGGLVVGSSTKGVLIFQKAQMTRAYTEKNGLSSRFVRKVLRQDKYIWVLTETGLDRIDIANGIISNYLEEYGLSNTTVNDFIIQKEKILFATTSGILVQHNLPRLLNITIKFPLLKATGDGVEITNNTTLPGTGKDIVFYFEALHYFSTTALLYQYRLKGLDTVWRTTNNFSNQLAFSRLAPGKYTFEIRARAAPNYKSEMRSFSFTVPRPYWQKAGFFILILIILILLLSLFLRQWKKSLLRRQVIKEQLLKSQLVALRAQMNPHFLYNVLNTVQGLVYGNRKTEAGELLGNFSDLMRKTLQGSDKQLLSLQDEIENLRLYLELEKARFDEGFSYNIEIKNIDDLSSIYIPSLMLQPFAENSVKHGLMHKQGSKKVEIIFTKQVDGLMVIIDDNGIGRVHSMEINQRTQNKPFSFATVALNERMDLFNRLYKQKITCRIIDKIDERQQSLGTRIELFIPDYKNDPQAL